MSASLEVGDELGAHLDDVAARSGLSRSELLQEAYRRTPLGLSPVEAAVRLAATRSPEW